MKTHYLVKSIGLILLAGFLSFSFSSPKKDQRIKLKADRFFDNFAYSKAVPLYEKIALESEVLKEESILKIADSYRLMNKPMSAEKWYQKLEGSTLMTTQNKMNYAQVLLKNGKDAEAEKITSQLNQEEINLIKRLKGVENIEIFFRDSSAYFVENMNINSEESDFSPSYYDGGIVFVSNRKNWRLNQSTYYWDDSYFLDLYHAKADENGVVGEPESLTKRINTIFHEGPSVFFENDTKVIFTRNNFNLGEERTSVEGVNKLKLYYAEKNKKGKWSKPVAMPFSTDEYSVGHPTITPDGKTLFFAADLPGTQGKADIWKTEWANGQWGAPENLGDQINTPENELFPFIEDTGVLYFASEGHPGIGGLDIYKVDLNGGNLTPENMGYPVNTKDDDFGMIMKGENGYLSSNRSGGKGNDDILKYTVYRYNLTARLVDDITKVPLEGSIQVINESDKNELMKEEGVSKIDFVALRGRAFLFGGQVIGYEPTSLSFDTQAIPLEAEEYVVDIPMKKINRRGDILIVKNFGRKDQVFSIMANEFNEFPGSNEELESDYKTSFIDLENTYTITGVNYDFDKSNIREDSKNQLDLLISLMTKYEDLKAELSSHTDSRGSKTYNERLSRRRAESARDYLVAGGVDSARVSIKYFGKSEPVDCLTADCDEQAHERNRRTEIRILQ